MYKKIVFVGALLAGMSAVAMDVIQEEALKFILDDQNSGTTHELEIPVELARLIGAFRGFGSELQDNIIMRQVSLPVWECIQEHLMSVCVMTHHAELAAQMRPGIFNSLARLDGQMLIEFIRAVEFLDIPILLAIACEVVRKGAPGKISSEDIASLPESLRNHLILGKIVTLVGVMGARELAVYRGHEGPVTSVCVMEDGKIVSGSGDGTVRVCDIAGNELRVFRGHEGPIRSVCVTKKGKIVSVADNTIYIWDMEGREPVVCRGHEGHINSVCVTKDDEIVSGSSDGTVRVWSMEGKELAVRRVHKDSVTSVCVTKNNEIVSGSLDAAVSVWDRETNESLVHKGHSKGVLTVSVAKDGTIVSGSLDNTVRLWDMKDNQCTVCTGHESFVKSVCVMKDRIISGSADKTVRKWDMKGNQLALCRGHEKACTMKNGKIVLFSADPDIMVWDMEANPRAICSGHEGPVSAVCVMRDGTIVSGSADNTVRVWDVSLLSRIASMNEFQAKALWNVLIEQGGHCGNQWCRQEIERILHEEVPSLNRTITNDNNKK